MTPNGGQPAAVLDDVHVPPQNLDAEESVLGAMMLSPGAIASVSEILTSDGREFYREAVTHLTPEEWRGRIDDSLRSLVLKQLIRPSGSGFAGAEAYRFNHLLTHDAAYAGVAAATCVSIDGIERRDQSTLLAATPKSSTRTCRSRLSSTLPGLKSPCTTPCS